MKFLYSKKFMIFEGHSRSGSEVIGLKGFEFGDFEFGGWEFGGVGG